MCGPQSPVRGLWNAGPWAPAWSEWRGSPGVCQLTKPQVTLVQMDAGSAGSREWKHPQSLWLSLGFHGLWAYATAVGTALPPAPQVWASWEICFVRWLQYDCTRSRHEVQLPHQRTQGAMEGAGAEGPCTCFASQRPPVPPALSTEQSPEMGTRPVSPAGVEGGTLYSHPGCGLRAVPGPSKEGRQSFPGHPASPLQRRVVSRSRHCSGPHPQQGGRCGFIRCGSYACKMQ